MSFVVKCTIITEYNYTFMVGLHNNKNNPKFQGQHI